MKGHEYYSQFRYGNWIFCGDEYQRFKYFDGNKVYTTHGWHLPDDEVEECIPLTPEILEKVGFVSEQEGHNDFDIKATWVYDAFILIEYNNGDFVFDHEMNIEPLCVHSLQNLYFALTQTELPINL